MDKDKRAYKSSLACDYGGTGQRLPNTKTAGRSSPRPYCLSAHVLPYKRKGFKRLTAVDNGRSSLPRSSIGIQEKKVAYLVAQAVLTQPFALLVMLLVIVLAARETNELGP